MAEEALEMINSARNPKWTDASHTAIILEVRLNNEWAGFVARPEDCMDYGRQLYWWAANKTFGEIADSDEEQILSGRKAPPNGFIVHDGKIIDVGERARQAAEELNRRLSEFTSEESKAMAELDEAYAANRKAKMRALLAVKDQPGWPIEVKWPK